MARAYNDVNKTRRGSFVKPKTVTGVESIIINDDYIRVISVAIISDNAAKRNLCIRVCV